MKTKRLIALTLALLLTLTASSALAESIFGTFQDEPEAELLLAPSYGGMANVEPDLVEESAEGGAIVTYLNVNAAGVNSFGEYLGKLGFTVAKQEEQAGKAAFAVTDGQVDFVMIYDQAAKTMQLIYPEGTDYARALFPGYTRIEFNEEIQISGLGRFTFHDFFLNDQGGFRQGPGDQTIALSSWLWFSFYNISTTTQLHLQESLLFDATLVYHNADGEYQYQQSIYTGGYIPEEKLIVYVYQDGEDYYDKYSCPALTGMESASSFILPADLCSSTDGTIAIKLDFKTGEKYVLVARENGIDLNIAPSQSGN